MSDFDLKQSREIAYEYSKPYSMIDNGNLFYALGEFMGAYDQLKASADKLAERADIFGKTAWSHVEQEWNDSIDLAYVNFMTTLKQYRDKYGGGE